MIRLAAVGDLMLSDSSVTVGFGVHSRYPARSLAAVFTGLAPRLHAADIAIGNLESPLTRTGVGGSRWARDQMRGDPEYARVLREAGFTAIAVANNHAVQHGESAFHETVAALRAEGLLVLGLRGSGDWHAEPATFTHRDTGSVALLAYSWRPRQYGEGTPPYADVQEGAVLADVARARASHSSVVVSLHWGEEFVPAPSTSEVRFAHQLVSRGADVVLGHHPHVVRPVERVNDATIAYSLGNCVTDMLWQPALRTGTLLEMTLDPRPGDVKVTTMTVGDDYRIRLHKTTTDLGAPITGLETTAYDASARTGLNAQRAAAYAYAARNVFRFPPSVLATLVGTTVANKLGALVSRPKAAR